MTYKELKTWFRDNYKTLPESFVCGCKTYNDVRAFVVLNIKQIDSEIERHGPKIRYSAIARSSKANLIELYEELEKHS